MNWLRQFMMGRYGTDQLSIGLLVLYMLLTFAASISREPIVMYISYVPLILSVLRIFSRNTYRRRQENQMFLNLINPIYSWFRKRFRRAKESKTYRHFDCPNCKQGLRVPKGKGKIRITCPKCKTEFVRKT